MIATETLVGSIVFTSIGGQVQDLPLQGVYLFFGFTIVGMKIRSYVIPVMQERLFTVPHPSHNEIRRSRTRPKDNRRRDGRPAHYSHYRGRCLHAEREKI